MYVVVIKISLSAKAEKFWDSQHSACSEDSPDCADVNSIHRKGEAASPDRKIEFSIKLLILAERAAQDAGKKKHVDSLSRANWCECCLW